MLCKYYNMLCKNNCMLKCRTTDKKHQNYQMKIHLLTLCLSICAATNVISEGTQDRLLERKSSKSLLNSVPWFHLRNLVSSSHKFQDYELQDNIRNLNISKKKRLLLLSVLRGNEKLVNLLIQDLSLEDNDVTILTNRAIKRRKLKILPLLVNIKPSLALEIILNRQRSDQVLTVLQHLTLDNLRGLSPKVLKKLVDFMVDYRDFDLLFKVGSVYPVYVFKEIVKMKDLRKISEFIASGNFSRQDRIEIYKVILDNYIYELMDISLMQELKQGLYRSDLEELDEYKEKILDTQCELCMDKVKVLYFSCIDSRKYGHGACKECFYSVMERNNPKCPWCRTSIEC